MGVYVDFDNQFIDSNIGILNDEIQYYISDPNSDNISEYINIIYIDIWNIGILDIGILGVYVDFDYQFIDSNIEY